MQVNICWYSLLTTEHRDLFLFQPEQAIEVYEAALKRNPRDSILASKIGQALIRTHNYNKVKFYCCEYKVLYVYKEWNNT